MQLSMILSERTWPGVGDRDDCWVLSALQCTLAVAPWLHLPGSQVFRAAAGDPDDGKHDGGNIAEIIRGTEGTWPLLDGKLTALRGVPMTRIVNLVEKGRPVSIALMSGKLPPRIRHMPNDVAHQCSLFAQGDRILFANPMAQMADKLDEITWKDVRPAILAYGNGQAFGVAWPTADELASSAPGFAAALSDAIAHLPRPDCAAAVAAARAAGFADAKVKAGQAVAAIAP